MLAAAVWILTWTAVVCRIWTVAVVVVSLVPSNGFLPVVVEATLTQELSRSRSHWSTTSGSSSVSGSAPVRIPSTKSLLRSIVTTSAGGYSSAEVEVFGDGRRTQSVLESTMRERKLAQREVEQEDDVSADFIFPLELQDMTFGMDSVVGGGGTSGGVGGALGGPWFQTFRDLDAYTLFPVLLAQGPPAASLTSDNPVYRREFRRLVHTYQVSLRPVLCQAAETLQLTYDRIRVLEYRKELDFSLKDAPRVKMEVRRILQQLTTQCTFLNLHTLDGMVESDEVREQFLFNTMSFLDRRDIAGRGNTDPVGSQTAIRSIATSPSRKTWTRELKEAITAIAVFQRRSPDWELETSVRLETFLRHLHALLERLQREDSVVRRHGMRQFLVESAAISVQMVRWFAMGRYMHLYGQVNAQMKALLKERTDLESGMASVEGLPGL